MKFEKALILFFGEVFAAIALVRPLDLVNCEWRRFDRRRRRGIFNSLLFAHGIL